MARGFTLVEALIVIVMVALLTTLAVPFYGALKVRAGLAGCLGNLRSLSVALNGYLQDNNMIWPQLPQSNNNSTSNNSTMSGKQINKWWRDTLTPFGITERNWVCPNDSATLKHLQTETPDQFNASSYTLTQFDELPGAAFKWQQPWVMERAGFHGKTRGPNMLMPDGTIQEGVSLETSSGGK
jgi:prepilin-type N-terminal cleavage/methylation domain-containing protein